MKLVKSKERLTLPVATVVENVTNKHGRLLPNQSRALFTGPSGSGKTNVMIGLLTHPRGLRYEHVYLFSKTSFQPMYKNMQKIIESIPGMSFNHMIVSGNRNNQIPSFPTNSIVIFDDVTPDSFQDIRNCFSYGRHNNIDVFFLIQTYTAAPKHLCRDNSNFIVLFKQDSLNLKHVYDDHVMGDMDFPSFQKMCHIAWQEPYSYLSIVKDFPLNAGRYRQGLDNFFQDIAIK